MKWKNLRIYSTGLFFGMMIQKFWENLWIVTIAALLMLVSTFGEVITNSKKNAADDESSPDNESKD